MTATYGNALRLRPHRPEDALGLRASALNWTFSPALSLQAYLQPFISVGAYDRFKELARPRSYDYNVYGEGAATVVRGADGYDLDPDGAGPLPRFPWTTPIST